MSAVFNIPTKRIATDTSKVVNRVSMQYENLETAFQKEAIQNSWDARTDKKTAKDWLVNVYQFTDTNNLTHIVVEDSGTTGMNSKRWDGFSALWMPEKDVGDAGGKGQGKFVLMQASQPHVLFVESVSEEGYICKFLQDDKSSLDKQNLEISKEIPGATKLAHTGTRVWVYNVKDDFLKLLQAPEFQDSIVECWWQVLNKERFSGKIHLFDKEVEYGILPKPVKEEERLTTRKIGTFGRIKRLRLGFYGDTVPSNFDGIMVQRANMTICKINFDVSDADYKGRFSGFIEFDKKLEEALKEIEKNDHCGFQYSEPWTAIKKLIAGEAGAFVNKIVPSQKSSLQLKKKNVLAAIKKANQIIQSHCPQVIGTGSGSVPLIEPTPKPPIHVAYLSVEKSEVKWGDTISPRCGVANTLSEEAKVCLEFLVRNQNKRREILKDEFTLQVLPGKTKPVKLPKIHLAEGKFDAGKYTIVATLKDRTHSHTIHGPVRTSFYLEIEKEPAQKGFVKNLEFRDFHGSDKRRRNRPIDGKGTIALNMEHQDLRNLWNDVKKSQRTKQLEYYMIKLCLDEAIKELLKLKLMGNTDNQDDTINEVRVLQDEMYYNVYT